MSKPLIAITGASSGIGEGIEASHVADMILFAYQMPQKVLIQEMVATPTRQEY